MEDKLAITIGDNLRVARVNAGLAQSELARSSGINRIKIIRTEAGEYIPRVDELLRLAEAFRLPLQWFIGDSLRPPRSLQGIAFELYQLGVRDVVVEGAVVPGAFRRPEEVIALVLRGDRPETRLIDAMPFVLATCSTLDAGLVLAFGDLYDPRVRNRLAWLCDVTLILGRFRSFPVEVRTQGVLERIVGQVEKPAEPDDLGSPAPPGSRLPPPVWRRWRITYGGTMDDFLVRATELAAGGGNNRP